MTVRRLLVDMTTLADVQHAARLIRNHIHRTPVLTSSSINQLLNVEAFFKCENFQKVGAFKFRGACNAVMSLSTGEAAAGVATHSSGNHAAAVALAARQRGVKAYIVMPRTAPEVKKAAVAGYGGEITLCEPTLEARDVALDEIIARTGATMIHAYNDRHVIAGQGTAALELLEEFPDLDVIMAPVGGGGLLAGTAIAASETNPGIHIIAAEPEEADDAYRSLQAGRILPSLHSTTIADGLLTSLGDRTFAIIQSRVERIVTVSEEAIIQAMRHIWERMKIIVEPSAAVAPGALLEGKIDLSGQRVGIILSGGNVDLNRLPW
jgi:threonine dehydratase